MCPVFRNTVWRWYTFPREIEFLHVTATYSVSGTRARRYKWEALPPYFIQREEYKLTESKWKKKDDFWEAKKFYLS